LTNLFHGEFSQNYELELSKKKKGFFFTNSLFSKKEIAIFLRNASFFLVGKNTLSHLDTGFSVWDSFFLFFLVFYSLDKFFQTLEKLVLCDFFGILIFSDFLKTNFVICSTKNMRKHFVLSDKLLHVACDTWPSLRNIFFWHICNVLSNTQTHVH